MSEELMVGCNSGVYQKSTGARVSVPVQHTKRAFYSQVVTSVT